MGEILALPKIVFHINEEVRIRRMNLRVVLVEPMYDGNIGSVARSMKKGGLRPRRAKPAPLVNAP